MLLLLNPSLLQRIAHYNLVVGNYLFSLNKTEEILAFDEDTSWNKFAYTCNIRNCKVASCSYGI